MRSPPPCAKSFLHVYREDDANWPKPNIVGKQELEIRVGSHHISFETAKIGSLMDVSESEDPEGLRVFYYLVQDVKVPLSLPVSISRLTYPSVPGVFFDLAQLQDQADLDP